MSAIYWFALIVGGGLLAATLLDDPFDLLGDGGVGDGAGEPSRLLSLRLLTNFLFAFGAAGLLAGLIPGLGPIAVPLTALTVGVLAGLAVSAMFGYVQRTATGEREGEESFVGCIGRVVLPVTTSQPGRVMVTRGSREFELRARLFQGESFEGEIGRSVVVVEMTDGTALVAPLEDAPVWSVDA